MRTLKGTPRPYLTFIVGTLVQSSQCMHQSSVLVLFGYAQTALNADATFKFRPHDCDKGLLPTMWCKLGHEPLGKWSITRDH